jgi:hypothetical protein
MQGNAANYLIVPQLESVIVNWLQVNSIQFNQLIALRHWFSNCLGWLRSSLQSKFTRLQMWQNTWNLNRCGLWKQLLWAVCEKSIQNFVRPGIDSAVVLDGCEALSNANLHADVVATVLN